MELFSCTLNNIQHIKKLFFEIDLSRNQLICIVGKNGVGKTTLIRAIKNIQSADTFAKTASTIIFNNKSHISYTIDGNNYDFKFNPKLKVIDTKAIILEKFKEQIHVELPIPHGERFKHFQRLGEIDTELRRSITLGEYKKPDELIRFLAKVYNSDKFANLKEFSVKNTKYYFILKDDDFYIREDYLSSGEYFIINLYKMINRKCKLIVIDEIDISLDASAQVMLINQLRKFCFINQINIVFTTHSLAIMKTLSDSELFYMDENDSNVTLNNISYNYVKSILFGFRGWDKYILTEDEVLKEYLTYLITHSGTPLFYKYKIIYIAGGTNVISLMNRNTKEHFFALPDNVISVLDGDQNNDEARLRYCKNNDKVLFIPFQSVEKQLKTHYDKKDRDGLPLVQFNDKCHEKKKRKNLYNSLVRKKSAINLFSFINRMKKTEVSEFKAQLIKFLNK